MPGSRSLSRAATLAVILLSGLPAVAGQRTGTLAVTVQVVASCSASTSGGGVTQVCDTAVTPVAVVHERQSVAAASAGAAADAPVARTQEEVGIVTVIY